MIKMKPAMTLAVILAVKGILVGNLLLVIMYGDNFYFQVKISPSDGNVHSRNSIIG